MIWAIVGTMTKKFPVEMADYRLEIEELIFYNIKKQMSETKSIELKALEGMFTGLRQILRGSSYTHEEMKELYVYTTAGLHLISDIQNYRIIKQCLLLLEEHFDLFDDFLLKNEEVVVDLLMDLIRVRNRKVKESASDCFEAFFQHISKRSVSEYHKQLIQTCTALLKKRMRISADPVELMVCIRCYGLLAKAILNCFG